MSTSYGDLRSATFSHTGTSYAVTQLRVFKNTFVSTNTVSGHTLSLAANPPLPDGMVLQVGDRTFTVDTDSDGSTRGYEQWDIEDDPLNWTAGQHVTTSLTFYADATLSGLTVNDGTNDLTLDPTFDPATLAYTAKEYNGITTVTITATPNHSSAAVSAVTLDGTAIADTDFTDGITVPSLVLGDNQIVLTVTAEDNSTETYTITVTRVSDDANLSALSVVSTPGGHTVYLTPAFDAGTNTYTASVANRINAVKLTATKKRTSATVAITNDSDTSTPDEAEFDLSVGANTLTVTVTAENPIAQTYTVTVTRAAEPPAPTDCPADTDWCTTLTVGYDTLTAPDAEIEWLGYQSYATYGDLLSTTFSHAGTNYAVSLLYDFKNTPVGTNTADANSLNLTINPPLTDGAVLQVGNRTFTVDADSAGNLGGSEQWDILRDPLNWTEGQHVTVSLKLPTTLSALSIIGATGGETVTLSPAFNKNTFTYTATVPNGIDAVTVTAATNDSNATVVINADDDTSTPNTADLNLSVGDNTLTVAVTAEDATTTLTYTITVTRVQIPTVPVTWSLIPSGLSERRPVPAPVPICPPGETALRRTSPITTPSCRNELQPAIPTYKPTAINSRRLDAPRPSTPATTPAPPITSSETRVSHLLARWQQGRRRI